MSKRLLLADDSITIQKVVQITFAHKDYELTVTDNGDAALAKAREIVPQLILADVYMPGRNGYELCAAMGLQRAAMWGGVAACPTPKHSRCSGRCADGDEVYDGDA